MLLAANSWGSRTSIRRRESDGFSRMERTWGILDGAYSKIQGSVVDNETAEWKVHTSSNS